MLRKLTEGIPIPNGDSRRQGGGVAHASGASRLALMRLARLLARQAAREWAGRSPAVQEEPVRKQKDPIQ